MSLGDQKTVGGPIFKLSSDHATWPEAKSKCEAQGQRLAVIDSAEKQAALKAQV